MTGPDRVISLSRHWVSTDSGVWGMKRLNLTYFMDLGAALAPLVETPVWTDGPGAEDRIKSFSSYLREARRQLELLLQDEGIPLAIPASRPAAKTFAKELAGLLKKDELGEMDIWHVAWAARPLHTLLQGELAVQSVYHIWPKRAFDTNLLIDRATALFSKEIQDWFIPDETYNIEQAGKCIAFETPTAAGFHLIRAAESVIRRYYGVLVGSMPPVKARNWGAYIRVLRNHGAEPKILHALEQIKDLHRNPVVHPEVQLSLEEAVSLVGITESIISAIYTDMMQREEKAKQPTLALVPGGATNKLLAAAGGPELDEAIPF